MHLADKSVHDTRLLAGGATGGFEAIHLRFALAAEVAAGGLAVLLFVGTVVDSRVRIDPHVDGRVSLKMSHGRGCGSLGDSKRDERPFPRAERGAARRARRRPQ